MRTLAIETVGTTGSVAALEGERILAECQLDPARRSAQTLAPGIQELLARVEWRAGDVQLVAVAIGPGSFTGLRIGVTTAKAFAYAVGCPLIGVPTLLSIGSRVPADVTRFDVVLDAQRGELFVASFRRDETGELVGADTTRLAGRDDWLASLSRGDVVTGPGLEKLRGSLPPGIVTIDKALWPPTAGAVGQVGWRLHALGGRSGLFEIVPHYCRRTAAEEQWERRNSE